jgi:hypothetical protein
MTGILLAYYAEIEAIKVEIQIGVTDNAERVANGWSHDCMNYDEDYFSTRVNRLHEISVECRNQ